MSAAALAYDAIAARYDAQVQGDDWMRQALHAHYRRVFRAGDRVLDVGCGTGIDAVYLASIGVEVVAIDVSEAMIAQLRAKLEGSSAGARVDTCVLPIADMRQVASMQPFDGLISAFASLSAVEDLHGFARDAAALLRPRARMVLHLLNRFSFWEWLGYVGHADWAAARAVGRVRSREFVIGGQPVRHQLYFAREAYGRFFARDFVLRASYGLGAVRPPHTVRRIRGRVAHALEWLDRRSGALPLLQNAGRFFVLDLERRST